MDARGPIGTGMDELVCCLLAGADEVPLGDDRVAFAVLPVSPYGQSVLHTPRSPEPCNVT